MAEAVDEAATGAPSDAALISAVRSGDTTAYGLLYERHLGAARRTAAALVTTTAEREDLVAEAFTRVLRVLRAGQGPDESFRAYLVATMRNALITDIRRGVDVALCADVPEARAASDPVISRVEAGVAADAFATLPERWRTVLWHTEIEGESPAEIAPLLGLAPNSVSALAYRAREGLRQAYLRQHLPTVTRPGCRGIAAQLSIWVRRGCPRHTMRRITRHLDRCPDCRKLAGGLVKVNEELRAAVAPVVLGTPMAVAYLSGSGQLGAATASWLTAVKAAVAGAAVVVATGVTVHPPSPPEVRGPGAAVPQPVWQHTTPTPVRTGPPAAPPSRAPSLEQLTQPEPSGLNERGAGEAEKKTAKAERKAAKQPTKTAKQQARTDRKAAKDDAAEQRDRKAEKKERTAEKKNRKGGNDLLGGLTLIKLPFFG